MRDQVTGAGADYRLYELTCPEPRAWARIEARNRALGGSLLITRNTFEILKARFEPLTEDEERIAVGDPASE